MPRHTTNFLCAGSRLDIFVNFLGLSAPMIICSAPLIALVLLYQVRLDSDPNDYLFAVANATADPHSYYVNLDSTLLIVGASWMSTIAPFSSCFAIALAAYPIAQRLLHDSDGVYPDRLPTPYQLYMSLRLIDGGTWAALWNLLLYNESWKKRANRHAVVLASLSAVTISTIVLRYGLSYHADFTC